MKVHYEFFKHHFNKEEMLEIRRKFPDSEEIPIKYENNVPVLWVIFIDRNNVYREKVGELFETRPYQSGFVVSYEGEKIIMI